MYPGMAKTAREEGFDEIADWFETLAKAERSHANRFQKALDGLDDFGPRSPTGSSLDRASEPISSRPALDALDD